MVIAISGSQGSGKSTVLNELKKRGHNIVERKTSRSILEDWGVTLQQVNNNADLTIDFQNEIINRKRHDEQPYVRGLLSDDLWFTERTYADLFTYSLITLGKDNQYSDFIDNYFRWCKKWQENYSNVFYIEGGIFDVEHDGVRGSNKYYSMMADVSMKKFTRMMSSNYHTITQADINDRVDFILEVVYNNKEK